MSVKAKIKLFSLVKNKSNNENSLFNRKIYKLRVSMYGCPALLTYASQHSTNHLSSE
jgi:hypothetical protein